METGLKGGDLEWFSWDLKAKKDVFLHKSGVFIRMTNGYD